MDSVSLSHHTMVEIATKIHEPSMQFPQYNCRGGFKPLCETDLWGGIFSVVKVCTLSYEGT
jgi:hypothetical protein